MSCGRRHASYLCVPIGVGLLERAGRPPCVRAWQPAAGRRCTKPQKRDRNSSQSCELQRSNMRGHV
eukprot:7382642-Prymnesium_polylepis.3